MFIFPKEFFIRSLKAYSGLFLFTLMLVLGSNQKLMALPVSSGVFSGSLVIGDLQIPSHLQKVHGYHCHINSGHMHREHCAGHPLCFRNCYKAMLWRFNCKNLYQFCLKSGQNRAECRQRYNACRNRVLQMCRRTCHR